MYLRLVIWDLFCSTRSGEIPLAILLWKITRENNVKAPAIGGAVYS